MKLKKTEVNKWISDMKDVSKIALIFLLVIGLFNLLILIFKNIIN